MILQQILDRLTDAKAELGLKFVGGAAEFAALNASPPKHLQPAAYVIPGTERASRNQLVGKHRQRVTTGYIVILALGNLRDPNGLGASIALEQLIEDVRQHIAGWKPEGAVTAMQYESGRLQGVQDQVVWRQLNFTLDTMLNA